jgi:Eukaryotic aspartyl protease
MNAAGASECVWQTSYQEGSNWTAFEAMDRCYLGSWATSAPQMLTEAMAEEDHRNNAISMENSGLDPNHAARDFSFDLRFGCQTQLSGLFRTQATAGIMGLDRAGTAAAVWSQMFQQGKIAQPAFSLCLARAPHEHSFAGALTLGGTDARLHNGGDDTAMVYAAMNSENRSIGYFAVQLRQLYLRFQHTRENAHMNAKTVPIHPGSGTVFRKRRIVIDSGTTDTFFVQE